MKKSILISYQAMMVGGSTTSLLGLLYSIDYNKYDIDLLLNTNTGELLNKLPNEVHLLPPALKYPSHTLRKIRSLFSVKYMRAFFKARKIAKESGNVMHGVQYLEAQEVIKYRNVDNEYDVAIAFLEGINCKFVANHIAARKKIAWIHIDYEASGFNPEYDRESMSRFDNIVTVSEKCRDAFCRCFPSLSDKVCSIENIVSTANIRALAEESIDFNADGNYINLVTACRIEFHAKALDRAVKVFADMKKRGSLRNLRWYIIGDGNDFIDLERMIKENDLEDRIILLGKKTNPYPYLKKMDIFFLPSKYEGKPMAITEALILGLPALVTNYASAGEQIDDGNTGMIVENNEAGIEFGLNFIGNNPKKISEWKQNVSTLDLSDDTAIRKIVDLIDN